MFLPVSLNFFFFVTSFKNFSRNLNGDIFLLVPGLSADSGAGSGVVKVLEFHLDILLYIFCF